MMTVCILVLTACGAGNEIESPPTLTLIPPSETPQPTAIPPSATPDPLIVLPVPATSAIATATSADVSTPESLLDADPVAAELVALAQRRLAEDLGLPQRRIQLNEVQALRWSDTSLGCPRPDQTYVEADIPGYRIILQAGDDSYTFHTDFDRVLLCPEGSEVLPTPPSGN
ncbi:MAG: hypothetical protein KC547_00240 [Anaerolineae bacterium]|nr:hypothetical protein [Anaerolineae bacterium]